MGLLHWNWTEQQANLYALKVNSLNAAVAAFVTVVVHYAVSEWIWFGDGGSKRKPHRAPVYLISSCVFFYLWSTIFNKSLGHLPLGYVIATPIVGIVGGVLFNLAFCWIWTIMFPQADYSKDKEDVKFEEQDEGPTPEPLMKDTEAPPPKTEIAAAAPKKKPNYMYITNIKIFLTAMVLTHHCVTTFIPDNEYLTLFFPDTDSTDKTIRELLLDGAVMGYFLTLLYQYTNSCYFMQLFFFFSGYFAPRSFDKRGTKAFLMGRARRLGIPLVLLAYFFSCARKWFEEALMFETNEFVQPLSDLLIWSPDQAWFLMMLMLYGIAYAFLCGKGWSPKVACPSIFGFFASSIVLGLTGFVLTLCFPINPPVMSVPNSPATIPSHILFFFFGAVAQRNNWMEEIHSKSRIAIYAWAFLSWLIFTVIEFYSVIVLARSAPLWSTVHDGFFVYGYLSVPISLAVTVFFMDLLNKKYFFTDFFAQSMYTAYIIQRFPIVIAMYLWNLVLEATGNVVTVTEPNNVVITGNMVVPGVLFMATVTMIITWPLAFAIRSIPGFSKVL